MTWRLSPCNWPDPVKPLDELSDDHLENLIRSAESEKLRRESFPERCKFFRDGRCVPLECTCKPDENCWR